MKNQFAVSEIVLTRRSHKGMAKIKEGTYEFLPAQYDEASVLQGQNINKKSCEIWLYWQIYRMGEIKNFRFKELLHHE